MGDVEVWGHEMPNSELLNVSFRKTNLKRGRLIYRIDSSSDESLLGLMVTMERTELNYEQWPYLWDIKETAV
jgi:hypothetical protein